jgi:hypothetical protein
VVDVHAAGPFDVQDNGEGESASHGACDVYPFPFG